MVKGKIIILHGNQKNRQLIRFLIKEMIELSIVGLDIVKELRSMEFEMRAVLVAMIDYGFNIELTDYGFVISDRPVRKLLPAPMSLLEIISHFNPEGAKELAAIPSARDFGGIDEILKLRGEYDR